MSEELKPGEDSPEEPAGGGRPSDGGPRRRRGRRRPRTRSAVLDQERPAGADEPKPAVREGMAEPAEAPSQPSPQPGGHRGARFAGSEGGGIDSTEVTEAEGIDSGGEGRRGAYELLWSTGLPNVGAIAIRELGAFFVSPIGYVVAAVLVLPVSFLGYLARVGQGLPVTMDPIFGLIALLMVFFTPLYTMRLLAEERRGGTLEVLLTSPVRDWEVVVGKWLGGLLFYLATIAFTLVYVVLISIYTDTHFPASVLGLHLELPTVDYGRILAGYLGVVLVGAAWVALGLFASSLTSNQIIAAVLGVGLLLAFQYLFGTLATFLVSPYSDFFDYLNAANHANSFSGGRLVPRDAAYFLTVTAAALFLTTRVLESRKWR